MVRITRGRTLPLTALAQKHWERLNAITQSGQLSQYSLINRLISLHDRHVNSGDYTRASYYQELLRDACALLRKLIICPPTEMPAMVNQMTALHQRHQLSTASNLATEFGYELLNQAFQYDNWRRGHASLDLFNWLGIEICPYCNMAPVFRDDTRGFTVVSFDHFYDKASYPYFSLSFYNLIPACKVCNEVYKTSHPFTLDSHLHPYEDCYNDRNTFDHNFHEGCYSYGITINHDPADVKSAEYNADLGLLTRYNIPSAREFAERNYFTSQHYPPERKTELVRDWGLVNVHEVEQKICSNEGIPFIKEEIVNKLYGKLKRDFAFKSKLIDRQNPLLM